MECLPNKLEPEAVERGLGVSDASPFANEAQAMLTIQIIMEYERKILGNVRVKESKLLALSGCVCLRSAVASEGSGLLVGINQNVSLHVMIHVPFLSKT